MLVVGCAHSKVEEIVMEAKHHLNANVELVAGGLHLMPYSAEYITGLTRKLKGELGVRRIAPSHCTGVGGLQDLEGSLRCKLF